MNVRDLTSFVWRNISFAPRKNLSLVAIIALASALITGALMLGSAVRQSLRSAAEARTGAVEWALIPQNQWLSDELRQRVQGESQSIIQTEAFCYGADGVAVKIQLYGVDEAFFSFVYGVNQPITTALASPQTLQQLGLNEGQNLLLRLAKGSHYAEGVSWSLGEEEMLGLRLPLHVAEQGMGFQLSSGYSEGCKIFVPKSILAEKLGKEGGGNVLLIKNLPEGAAPQPSTPSLADYGLQFKSIETGQWELSSSQTFIPEAVGVALASVEQEQERIFTYFVNSITKGDVSSPYSFIAGKGKCLGAELEGQECSITQWLADDLGAQVGDELDITYFELHAQGRLSTASSKLLVKDIIPTADRRELSPPFPGFTDSESCNDWDPSIPVDTDVIRAQDETYWNDYQASPKLFVSLPQAQKLFGSASGNLSAIRFPSDCRAELESALAAQIKLFQAIPLKDINAQGTEQAMDFSGLFLALSFFVIIAAIILLVLISILRMEAKRYDIKLLQSLGYSARSIMRLIVAEFGFAIILGSLLGCVLARGYVEAILYLLNTIWTSVSGHATIPFYCHVSDFAIGFSVSAIIGLLAIYFVCKGYLRSKAADRQQDFSRSIWTRGDQSQLLLYLGLSLGCYLYNILSHGGSDIALFFCSSFLMLLLSFKLIKYGLHRAKRARLDLMGLALRHISRNISRSMAVISMLSLGMFICLLTILNHRSMGDDSRAESGTGGYYGILETVAPIRRDLDSEEARQEYKLPDGVQIQQLKRVDGSQAGCLNLNRVVRPQLMAAPASTLVGRFSFTDSKANWDMLNSDPQSRTIPVIADAEVIQWSLGLKIGDELDYIAEGGQLYRLKFVAGLQKSIFQGYVLVSEENLARMYPHLGGSQLMLLDFHAKPHLASICRSFERKGCFFTTAAQRLQAYNEVQNNYLMIFFALGTIGLVMATGGFTLLTQHQLIHRQHEFELLRKVGYTSAQIRQLILREHMILLGLAFAATFTALSSAIIPLRAQHLIAPPYGLMLMVIILISGTAIVLLSLLSRKHS